MRLPWKRLSREKVAGGKDFIHFQWLSEKISDNRDRKMVKEVDERQRERKNSFKMSRKDNMVRWER